MKLLWEQSGSRLYETGLDRGVFYPKSGLGVPWNGLVSVKEDIDSMVQLVMYSDGQKQTNQIDVGTFSATLDAITYPDEFLPYDGYTLPIFSNQPRPLFNLTYRTLIGSDLDAEQHGYKIHLVYNCMAKPTSKTHNSNGTSAEASTFSWELTTLPMAVKDMRASSHFVIDSTKVAPGIISAIENFLYGSDIASASFPTVAQLLNLFEVGATYQIIDNGDGTWTATGPDSAFTSVDANQFILDWPWLRTLDADSYNIKSY